MSEGVHNPLVLPDNIPAPVDDGGAKHLAGLLLPDIALRATDVAAVVVVFFVGEIVLSRLLFHLRIRDRPY